MTDINQPTGAPPRIVKGITFRCYRTGIMQYEWQSEDGRLAVGTTPTTYNHWAWVDGRVIGNRYRSLDTALADAVKASRSQTHLKRRLAVMND